MIVTFLYLHPNCIPTKSIVLILRIEQTSIQVLPMLNSFLSCKLSNPIQIVSEIHKKAFFLLMLSFEEFCEKNLPFLMGLILHSTLPVSRVVFFLFGFDAHLREAHRTTSKKNENKILLNFLKFK